MTFFSVNLIFIMNLILPWCAAGKIQCYRRDCGAPPPPAARCQKLPITPGSCCPKYKCKTENESVDTQQGREDPAGPALAGLLHKVKDSLINVLNNATDSFHQTGDIDSVGGEEADSGGSGTEGGGTAGGAGLTNSQNTLQHSDSQHNLDKQSTTSSSSGGRPEQSWVQDPAGSTPGPGLTSTGPGPGLTSTSPGLTGDTGSGLTGFTQGTDVVALPATATGKTPDHRWKSSLIGDKDVKVFLNFSWLDDNFQLEEDFSTAELFSKNLTVKIQDALNAGVGYVIVPEGEKPEIEDENSVHLIQTVKLDQFGNIDIETSISNHSKTIYSDFDNKFIKKVEAKTVKITEDIFEQMQKDFTVATTESLTSTNQLSDNSDDVEPETITATTQLSLSDEANDDENKSLQAGASANSETAGKNGQNSVSSDESGLDNNLEAAEEVSEEVIYISMNDDWLAGAVGIKERRRLTENLTDFLEKETGIKTIIVSAGSWQESLTEELDKYGDVYLIRGENESRFNIYKNTVPLRELVGAEKRTTQAVKKALEEGLASLNLVNNVPDTRQTAGVLDVLAGQEKGGAEEALVTVPDSILQAVAEIMGVTVLNHSSQPAHTGDTLNVFQEILIDAETLELLGKMDGAELTADNIPDRLKDLVLSALNQTNLLVTESGIIAGAATTPPTAQTGGPREGAGPATTPRPQQTVTSNPVIFLAVDTAAGAVTGLMDDIRNNSGIAVVNVENRTDEDISELLDQNTNNYFIRGKEDENGEISVNIYHNKVPLDVFDTMSKTEEIVLESTKKAIVSVNKQTLEPNIDSSIEDDEINQITESIVDNLANVAGIDLLDKTDLFGDPSSDNDTFVIIQDIHIDGSGKFNVTTKVSTPQDNDSHVSDLAQEIEATVIEALESPGNVIDDTIVTQSDPPTKGSTKRPKIPISEDDDYRAEIEEITDGPNSDFDYVGKVEIDRNAGKPEEDIEEIIIVLPNKLFGDVVDRRESVLRELLVSVTENIAKPPRVRLVNENEDVQTFDNGVLINYVNSSVYFDNNELNIFDGKTVEGVLKIFDTVDQVIKNSFQDSAFELKMNNAIRDGEEMLKIFIETEDVEDIAQLDTLKDLVESKTSVETFVFVNDNPADSTNIENNSKSILTVNFTLTDNKKSEATIEKNGNAINIESNAERNLILAVKESVAMVFNTELSIASNSEEIRQSLIVSIKSKTSAVRPDLDGLKKAIGEATALDTTVFLNESPIVISSIVDKTDRLGYLLDIELTDSGHSKGVIFKEGAPLNELDPESERIRNEVKQVFRDIYNTDVKFNGSLDKTEDDSAITTGTADKDEIMNDDHQLIVSIICTARCDAADEDEIEAILKSETKSDAIVFINEGARTIEKKIEEDPGKLKYIFNIELQPDSDRSRITVYRKDELLKKLEEPDLIEMKEFVDKIREIVESKFRAEENIKYDKTTNVPIANNDLDKNSNDKNSQSYDRVIKILADLFIRTLDLSFRIKGAMDRTTNVGDEVEFQIVTKQDSPKERNDFVAGDGNDSEIFQIPEMIKITPEDAIIIHRNSNESSGNNSENRPKTKPVIIDIESDQTINFNVSNGMVFEIDLSGLPEDKFGREKEIKERVRNLINDIKTGAADLDGKSDNGGPSESLSDAIIKNITQIVLLQMDEALRNGEKSSALEPVVTVPLPAAAPARTEQSTTSQFSAGPAQVGDASSTADQGGLPTPYGEPFLIIY